VSEVPALDPEPLPESLARQVDQVCNRFEAAWKAGGQPRLEDFLGDVPEPGRAALLRELISLDAYYRRRGGAGCAAEDYQARFPTLDAAWLAAALAEVVPQATTAPQAGDGAPADTAPGELPGEWRPSFGDYELLGELGRGGMGVVFRAEDRVLHRHVAVKTLKPDLAASATARQRFLGEARAAAAIEHDHVLPILHVGEDGGVPYLVLPLLHGESLETRLRREGKLPLAEVLRIGREAAEGLTAAHAKGVIHRDVKPANIWLESRSHKRPACELPAEPASVPLAATGKEPASGTLAATGGRVKLLDFGLALAAGGDRLTQSGAILGTPAYMAPEQARGATVDARADLFSLGCVLYQMATGQAPFAGKDTLAVLSALALEQPRSPRELDPELPAALSDLVMRLLAKSAADRPPTAADVADALCALEPCSPSEARPPSRPLPTDLRPPAAPASGRSRSRRWPILAVAAALIALASLAGLGLYLRTPAGAPGTAGPGRRPSP
jgi:serine/threonine protein kinase